MYTIYTYILNTIYTYIQWTTGLDRNSEIINCLQEIIGSFLEVQGLGLNTFTAMAWVQSLAEELRSSKSCGIAQKGEKKKKLEKFSPLLEGAKISQKQKVQITW